MTVLLSIETATDVCSVAVCRNGCVVAELTLDEPRRHAERLVPMIDEAMTAAGLRPGDLTAVAISAGPGSYTGLRIGVSTAKGLAFALSIPIVPVPSLQALAASVRARPGSTVVAAFGARRGEVYAQSFEWDGSALPRVISGPLVGVGVEVLPPLLVERNLRAIFVGDGAGTLSQAALALSIDHEVITGVRPGAASVALAAEELLRAGASVDADAFEPYYLREFTAKLASVSVFDRLPT